MSDKTYRVNLEKLPEFAGYSLASLERAAGGHDGPKSAKWAKELLARMVQHGYIREEGGQP
jgi:hypothetical protein